METAESNKNQEPCTHLDPTREVSLTRHSFFNVPVPFTLKKQVFDEWWPLVSNIWTHYGKYVGEKVTTITYYCRLKKPKKSSTAREAKEGEMIKKRNTSCRAPDLCEVKLIVRFYPDGTPRALPVLDRDECKVLDFHYFQLFS